MWQGKLGRAPKPLIDVDKMAFTKHHPSASDSLADDGSVRADSLDFCFYTPHFDEKVGNDTVRYDLPTCVDELTEHAPPHVVSMQPDMLALPMLVLILKMAFNLKLDPKAFSMANTFMASLDRSVLVPTYELNAAMLDALRELGVRRLVLDQHVRLRYGNADHPMLLAAADMLPATFPVTVWQVLDMVFFDGGT
jgi:hypothetical protein